MALRMGEERAADSGAERHGVSALDVVPVLIATALWSSSAILIDRLVALEGMTPLQITAWRAGIAAIVVAAVMLLFQPRAFRIGMRDLPVFVAAGVIGISLSYITWAASVQTNKPAVAASLSFSYPAFVAIGATVLFGARQRPMAIAAIMVNLVGCALVAGILSPAQLLRSPYGLLIGLSNGAAFAAYTLIGTHMVARKGGGPLAALFYTFLFGTLGIVGPGLIARGSSAVMVRLDPSGWALLLGLALGPTLAAYALFNVGLKRLPTIFVSLLTTMEPPLVALFAFIVLGRGLTAVQIAGICLIVAAVVAMRLPAAAH